MRLLESVCHETMRLDKSNERVSKGCGMLLDKDEMIWLDAVHSHVEMTRWPVYLMFEIVSKAESTTEVFLIYVQPDQVLLVSAV